MIIINICLNPLGFDRQFSYDRDPHTIKVVNDHTHIASYRRWCVGNVGERVLALDSRNAELAGGLSGSRRTVETEV
jgi:hypothetical protein